MKNTKKRITKLDKIMMKMLNVEYNFTFEQIGKLYDISKQRVHQIIKGE